MDTKKILIVDDYAANLDYLELIFKKEGYIIERANNGVEALEKVKVFMPDLIVLDNMMPKMSGKELTDILKSNPVYKNIPIIIFSAADNENLKADDFMSKPIVMSDLLEKVKAALNKR